MKSRYGFTMIELMIVILIIAVLAAVAIPLMRGRLETAKWSEAEATMAQLQNDVRTYIDKWGAAPTAGDFAAIGYQDANDMTQLNGQYFSNESYTYSATVGAGGAQTITVTCDNADNVDADAPKSGPTQRILTFTKSADGTVSTVWSSAP